MFLNDPDFCESRCPVCTRARRGSRLARIFQRIEMFLTCGGCPAGRVCGSAGKSPAGSCVEGFDFIVVDYHEGWDICRVRPGKLRT